MNRLAEKIPVNILVTLLLLIYLTVITYGLVNDKQNLVIAASSLALLPMAIFFFVFRLKLLGLATAFIIPLSVKIPVGGGSILSFPAEALVLAIAVVFIIYLLVRERGIDMKTLRHPLSVLILVDLGWSVFTGMLGEMPLISFKRILIKLIFIIVFYFLFLEAFSNRKNMKLVWILYAFGLIIPISWTIYNHSHYDFSKVVAFLMPLPFYNDHTLYATCIAFILPVIILFVLRPGWFGMTKRWRFIFIPLTILLITGEFFSFSRAAWLSIVAGMLAGSLVVFLRFRAVHLLLLVLAGAAVLAYYSRDIYLYAGKVDSVSRHEDVGEHMRSVINLQTDASNLERINRWQCALRMFSDRPVTGFGPGTYMFVYGRYQVTTEMTRISTNHGEKGNAHSEYLMYLSETGLPGLVIFLLLIYIATSKAIRIFRRSEDKAVKWLVLAILIGFISYIFHGNFNSFIDTDKASVLFYGALATIAAIDIYHTRDVI